MRIAVAVMFFVASNGLCQAPAKEPETTQALLAEVHQLRLAIESMTGASERVQIALYSLQMQDAAVARAAQRIDEVRNKCTVKEADRAHIASDVERFERTVASRGPNDLEAKAVAEGLPERKRLAEELSAELQSCRATEAEMSGQFRVEQAKLAELQDRITRLDAALAKFDSDGR
jgi:chromosome segregation ATPase